MIKSAPSPDSAARIWKATFSALATSILILATVVWPKYYSLDPTSVGGLTGLKPTIVEGPDAAAELEAIITGDIRNAEPAAQRAYAQPFRSETVAIQLASGEEVEFKAHMQEGDTLLYSWESPQPLYVDMHGEPLTYPREKAVRYEEIDGAQSAHGRATAPFSGMHGWYWMNTGDSTVVINLKVSGYFYRLEEVYRSSQQGPGS
jgi:hypothetical protein